MKKKNLLKFKCKHCGFKFYIPAKEKTFYWYGKNITCPMCVNKDFKIRKLGK